MQVTRVKLRNWRNFKSFDAPMADLTYILGQNASGKSNLLDVFRFLRDVSKPAGGGLQAAVIARGGISKLRCLHARRDPEVCIDIELSDAPYDEVPNWRYVLGFKSEGKGAQRILVSREEVWYGGKQLFLRPDTDDDRDSVLLLEEPEISLNDAVVKEIPLIIQRLQKNRKLKRQVLISTHSEALLSNPGVDGRGVILLEASADGSTGRTLQAEEASAIEAGLSVAEVVLPKTRPSSVNQLGFWE